ncbi:MAG: hypothetical protein AAGD01_02145 [Acidobacteriota bacterium]
MFRFFALSLPALILIQGLAHVLWGALSWAPDTALPARFLLGTWVLESFGLILLFLLLSSRGGNRWLAGLGAAWSAWIFRGPILVLTLVGATNQAHEPWWRLSLGWLVVYTVGGLLLALLFTTRRASMPPPALSREPQEVQEPESPGEALWTSEP